MSTCRVIRPPSTDACGEPAVYTIHWHDDDKTPACLPCAVYMKQVAESEHKMQLKVEKIP